LRRNLSTFKTLQLFDHHKNSESQNQEVDGNREKIALSQYWHASLNIKVLIYHFL
jgi:hypothetical protein